MKVKFILIITAIFIITTIPAPYFSMVTLAFGEQPPDTFIVNPPKSEVNYNNLRIWWIGKTSDLDIRIKGFYYQLDSGKYEFTEKNYATFYRLSQGTHTLRVKAVDENLVEDSSPEEVTFSVFSQVYKETDEFNNTDEHAALVDYNQMIEGTTEEVTDIDWYKFKVKDRIDVINILMRRNVGISETKVSVYYSPVSPYTLINEFKIDSSNNQQNTLTFGVKEGQTYYIKVEPRSFDPDIKKYSLTINATQSISNTFWDTEPNDSPEFASKIELSQVQNANSLGFSNIKGLTDWYKIHIDSPNILKMSISKTTVQIPQVRLYSSLPATEENLVFDLKQEIFQTGVTLGDYFLEVNTNTLDIQALYLIKFELVDIPANQTVELEPNNISPLIDPNSASELALETPLIGNSWDGDEDIDWFVIEVPLQNSGAGNSENQPMLSLSLSREEGVGRTSIQLYNPNLSKLAEREISPDSVQRITFASSVGLDGGKHYVKLIPQSESPRTQYQLTAFYFPSVKHSADAVLSTSRSVALSLGETLNVQLVWKPGNNAYFDLVGRFNNPDLVRYKSIPMYDDGEHGDGDANDGIYSGQFTPKPGDDVSYASVKLHVEDEHGNKVDFLLPEPVHIDTKAPEIDSVEHNADAVLVTGDRLIVKLFGEPNLNAKFDISSFLQGIEMYFVGSEGEIPPPFPPGFQPPPSDNGEGEESYYIGTYTVKPTDRVVNAKITVRLIDTAGNVTSKTIEQPITIAGDGPKVYYVRHNAVNTPLRKGETLVVTVKTELDANVEFRVDGRDSILMYDDGNHDDQEPRDGIYVGKYEVKSTDELEKVPVTVYVTKLGMTSVIEIAEKVTLDGVPPEPVRSVSAVDVFDDQGYSISVSWEEPADGIAYYNLYIAKAPISSTVNREPVQRAISSNSSIISVEENNTSYYIAVTAVDRSGNESKLESESSFGPVRALDNLSPPPVRIVSAFDTPSDFGKSITLEWNNLSNIDDLEFYKIYISDESFEMTQQFIGTIETLASSYDIPVSVNGVDYYFAVTAFDSSGNESKIEEYSTVGPVQAKRNIEQFPEQPLQIITGATGLIRHDDVVFRWTGGVARKPAGRSRGLLRRKAGEPVYNYRIDKANWETTENPEVTFMNLLNGEHVFTLRTEEAEISRSFVVDKTTLPASQFSAVTEPNSIRDTEANSLPLGFTLIGELDDTDYFHFRLSNPGWIDIFVNRENVELSLLKNSRVIGLASEFSRGQGKILSTGIEPGDYFIQITGESETYELSTAFYQIHESVIFEMEPNASSAEATPILLSKPLMASYLPEEQDWFLIQLDRSGVFIADSGLEAVDCELQLTLWNSALTKIVESPLFTASQLSSGTYYLTIQNASKDEENQNSPPTNSPRLQSGGGCTYHLTNALIDSVRMKVEGRQRWWTMEEITEAGESGSILPKLSLGDTLVIELSTFNPLPNYPISILPFDTFILDENNSGFYVGKFQIPDGIQKNNVPVQIRITDEQNYVTRFQPFYIDIDTKSSPIVSISHNAESPLSKDDILKVTLQAEPNAHVVFEIVDEEGNHLESVENLFKVTANGDVLAPGFSLVTGTYKVQPGDEFVGTVIAKLTRYNGREVTKESSVPVRIDAVPPAKITGLKAEDVPDDQGFMLKANWDSSKESDFSHYELYVQRSPTGNIENTTPEVDNLKTNSVHVEVDENGVDYYIAVVGVDEAGNHSDIAMTGPVSAVDNLVPEQVEVLTAFDTANDSGGSITLQWTQPSTAPDFDHYNIYVSSTPISPFSSLSFSPYTVSNHRNLLTVEVKGLKNNVPYYFAVTAVDSSDNESAISENSLFGPVSAVDDTVSAVSSITWLVGPEGFIRYGTVKFVWNRWLNRTPRFFSPREQSEAYTQYPIERYFYKLDNSVEKVTTENSVTFQNLKDGVHQFSIRAEGDNEYLIRNFTVQRNGLQESEPNDTIPQSVEFNLPYLGKLTSGDKDLYLIDKFQSQSPLLFVSISDCTNCELKLFDFASGELHSTINAQQSAIVGINPEREYLVEITGEDENYELIVDDYKLPEGALWEVEPNDSQDFATAISILQDTKTVEIIGSADADEPDWYYFTTKNNQNALYSQISGYDTKKVKLYSAKTGSINQIAEFSPLPNQNTFLSEIALASDTIYFMEVHSDSGSYSVKLNLTNIEPYQYEIEPNESKQTATTMTLENTIRGTNWTDEDEDWYQLNINQSGMLVLELYDLQIANYELNILNNRDEIIASSSNINSFHIQTEVQSGTYFIQIKPVSLPVPDSNSVTDEQETDKQENRLTLPSAGSTANAYELLAVLVNSAEFSVERTANRPPFVLGEGDVLKVRVVTTAGKAGTFDIGSLRQNIPMDVLESFPMIYTGEYRVTEGDNLEDAQIKVSIKDIDGKNISVLLSPSIDIDTKPPNISNIIHDAKKPVGAGGEIQIILHGEPNSLPSFQIVSEEMTTVPISMEETENGIYTGVYVVSEDENAKEAKVIGTLVDAAGNQTQKTADNLVDIDTTPPEITEVSLEPTTQILTDGEQLKVTLRGESGGLAYFSIVDIASNLRLYDDGEHDDGSSSDGVYVGTYIVKPGDMAEDAVVIGTLKDEAGNKAEMRAFETITIDATSPLVESVEHSADSPLSADEVLYVTVNAEKGLEGTWNIEDFKKEMPLYDDGTHGDETANDGIYTGKYIVRAGDNVKDRIVSATLVKKNGKSVTKTSLKKLTLDTVPPEPVTDVVASDVPEDSGYFVSLKWSISTASDFDHYSIYVANMPITQLEIDPVQIYEEPVLRREDDTITTQVEVEKNDIDYFFAVTAVDNASNESELLLKSDNNDSVAGPVRTIDNLAPPVISGLEAFDTPNDYGSSITVSWSEPSPASDFDHYNIYLSRESISDLSNLNPVIQIRNRLIRSVDVSTTDGIDYYVAVTAVDSSENESEIATVGPVQSVNNIGDIITTSIRIKSGPVGQIRQRTVTFHWSQWVENKIAETFLGGKVGVSRSERATFSYKLDSGNYQYTNKNRTTFFNLSEGEHKFFLKTSDGEIVRRTFNVQPLFSPESEPNNSPNLADSISPSAIVRGDNIDDADEDWYLLDVIPTSNSLLVVHFVRPNGIGKSFITLFKDQRIISEFTVSPETHQRGILDIGIENTGEYEIRIRAEGENPSAMYELSIFLESKKDIFSDIDYLWEVEFNDQFEFATQLGELSKPIEVTGSTNQQNDVDWYKFSQLPAEDLYLSEDFYLRLRSPVVTTIQMVRPESLANTKVEIYYQNPAIDSNKVSQLTLSPTNRQQASIDFATRKGGYFIKVENSESDVSNYIFRTETKTVQTPEVWEVEPNNSSISANTVEISDRIVGNLWHPIQDSDWYKINVPERGILALTLKVPEITGIVTARLFESRDMNSEFDSFTVSPGSGSAGYFDATLASGDYYIQISHETTETPENYRPLDYFLNSILVKNAFYKASSSESFNSVVDVLGVEDEITVSITFPDWIFSELNFADLEIDFTLGEMVNNTVQPLPNFELIPMESQDDGVYSGKYVVEPNTNISDGFVLVELRTNEQESSIIHRIVLEPPITIDTLPPKIVEIRHNGDSQHPFSVDEELKVRVISQPNYEGEFEVRDNEGNVVISGELYDDGEHEDENPNDGVYGGIHVVSPGENASPGTLTVWLEDRTGNRTEEIEARRKIFIDTVPPEIEQISYEIIRTEEENGESNLYAPPNTLRASDVLKVMLTGEKYSQAEFDIGDIKTGIKLFDDGTHGDKEPRDGVYTNSYVVRKEDNVDSAVITGRLIDSAGNKAEIESPTLISIDTTVPQIVSVIHDAQKPLVKGDILTVKLEGEQNLTATFDIGELVKNVPMADDGAGVDSQANDGIYTGTYRVKERDNAKDATVIGHLIDKSGNLSSAFASDKVTIDAVAPQPVTGVTASDVPDDQGNVIQVIWNASEAIDFGRYNIYREASPILTTVGLIPVKSSLVFEKPEDNIQKNTTADIIVPANNVDYYIAVTVVDDAGNESSLADSSTFGPVQAKDNIMPEPVRGVEAKDKPEDNGKTLTVSWQPLPLTEKQLQGIERDDFEQYQIYVSKTPFEENSVPEELEPITVDGLTNRDITSADVPVEEDNVDYFVAVTALDEGGNESKLDESSTAGPVESNDEIAPEPVTNVSANDTPSDSGGSISVSWNSSDSEDVTHYNIYLDRSEITMLSEMQGLMPVSVTPDDIQLSEDEEMLTYTVETRQDGRNYFVAVTALDSGGNESEIGDSSTAGPVQSVSNRVFAEQETVISAGFAPDTKLIIPPNAVSEGKVINIFNFFQEDIIQKINEANHFLEESHIDETVDEHLKNTVVHFAPSDLEFRYPVEIMLSYELPVDVQNIWESELRIFKLNENRTVAQWELVSGNQQVDEENDTVTANIQELGVFRVARLQLPKNLENVVIYPNPFNLLKSSRMTFLNLARNSSISIYTINGELVRSIDTTEMSEGRAIWNGRNDAGVEVAGGLYIYVVKSEGDKAIGKFLLIR